MAFAKTMLLTTEYTVCVQVGHNIGVQYVFNNFAAYSSLIDRSVIGRLSSVSLFKDTCYVCT